MAIKEQKILHYPRLDSVFMIEKTIEKHEGKLKKKQLWEKLPKKMMYQTYSFILDYLISLNKVIIKDKRIKLVEGDKIYKLEKRSTNMRTHNLGELDEKLAGEKVKLVGWVDVIREHGKLIFVDLRDRYGKAQCVIHEKNSEFNKIKKITRESCILIEGEVKIRPKGSENKEISSGNVEIGIEKVEIFTLCPVLPFEIGEVENEDLRLKYRFLDLRSKKMQNNIIMRSKILKFVRDYFDKQGFIDIETPILAKSTPEGARDYIVPSRNFPGKFYALPQSPQLFKQMAMVAGFDKYIQIARCFRDEDLRSDRQPEFTQIDLEMSFIEQDDIINVLEGMLKYIFKESLNVDVKTPFPRITYDEAMKKYKTDRPDMRKNKADDKEFAFCWVVDFPLFEYSKEDKRHKSTHHPFTMPDVDFSEEKKKLSFNENSNSVAYDVILNGSEIGGGSLRIHDTEIQEKVFELLKISKKEAQEKFGFLLDALNFGACPHGGIALGFDRLVQIMLEEESIRECIAFPKNKEAKDVMLDAPGELSARQLKDVHISVIEKKKGKK